MGPRFPQVVVLFGATGDLAHRKLLPGLFYLSSAGFIPGCRIVGVSLDEINADTFRSNALKCSIDNWRWAGVPFFLRTGKRLAEGQRIISIAFRADTGCHARRSHTLQHRGRHRAPVGSLHSVVGSAAPGSFVRTGLMGS